MFLTWVLILHPSLSPRFIQINGLKVNQLLLGTPFFKYIN